MKAREPLQPVDLAHAPDFSLGCVHVRPSLREVVVDGSVEQVEPRVMQVLVALADRRSEVVSRDELIQRCWDGRVVGEDAVSRCIARVRRLGETHAAFALETIPRVGYRLTPSLVAPETVAATPEPLAAELPSPPIDRPPEQSRPGRAQLFMAGAAIVLGLAALAVWRWEAERTKASESARRSAEVIELVAKDQNDAAFSLARPLVQAGALARDAALKSAWEKIALPMRPRLETAGATVYFKPYADEHGEWIPAGVTPFSGFIDAPRGTLRIKVTKPGFRTAYFAVANPGPSVENNPPNALIAARGLSVIALPMAAENELGDDQVLVPHTDIPVFLAGWSTDMSAGNFRHDIPAFAIDRDEVTNQAFKEFIDAGGYDNAEYWRDLRFEADGRELSWPEARAKFVDATNRPGPASWQLSTYPSGQAELPVVGISWYEAFAYARFRKRALPTIHHWVRAAFAPYDPHFSVAPVIAAHSRFSAEGPLPAHSDIGLGPWGTHQMAGNVREWVENFDGARALAVGGAWSDYASESQSEFATEPMTRSPAIGLRLMQTRAGTAVDPALSASIRLLIDQPGHMRTPVSDAAFDAMRFQFTSEHVKVMDATVREVERSLLSIAEEVTLTLSNQQTETLFVVRPIVHRGPLQPIVYAPPADCCGLKRANRNTLDQLKVAGFIVDSGRALVMPIWWGSYERALPFLPDAKAFADRQRQSALEWEQDLRLTLDYLASRTDIDAGKTGFFGFSRGATRNSITLALEPRMQAAVLLSGGIEVTGTPHPMLDLVNYAPRIRLPVLMINGRFDHHYAYLESQRRLFDLLGTPSDRKAHIVYDTGHFTYPANSVARDASNWFDKQLGVAQ